MARVKKAKVQAANSKRLSPADRIRITNASGTLAEVAKQFGVSMNTVSKYRAKASNPTTSKAPVQRPTGDVSMKAEFVDGQFVVRFSQADILRMLADSAG